MTPFEPRIFFIGTMVNVLALVASAVLASGSTLLSPFAERFSIPAGSF
jgi:hypothetical protein